MTAAHVLEPLTGAGLPASGRDDDRPGRSARLRAVPPAPAAPPATPAVWWARIARRCADPVEHSLVAVNSDRFPDGTPVDLAALGAHDRRPAGWLVDLRYRAADGAVVRVDVAPAVAEPGVPLWFAVVHHACDPVPAASLLAFAGEHCRPGALVHPQDVTAHGARLQDHVGEIRWQLRSGLVESVVVERDWRRRGIGRLLTTAAEALRMLRGWPPLVADGRLTDDAAAWLATSPAYWRPRLAPRTHRLPPEADPLTVTGVARLLA